MRSNPEASMVGRRRVGWAAAALAAQIAGVRRSEAYALAQQLRSLDVVEGES